MDNNKLGLVFSGGGAKGAYQAGILEYMAEKNIQPDMVAGTSIGALNGAIVAAQKDIKKASVTVSEIWNKLSETNPLKVKNTPIFITSIGIIMSFSNVLSRATLGKFIDNYLDRNGVLDDQSLTNILDDYAPIELLKSGLPFYVSLYESEGSSIDIAKYLSQLSLNISTKDSVFKKVQSLNPNAMHEIIMASAALPYLFKAKELEGKKYRDGGMGGAFTAQGNTPAEPLVAAGCSHLIVSLLDDGSVFDRHNSLYKDVAIIEVRPKEFLSKSMLDMLAFTPEKIGIWKRQGYDDAKRCIGDSLYALELLSKHEESKVRVSRVIDKLESDGFCISKSKLHAN